MSTEIINKKIRKQYRLIFFNFIIKSKEKHSQLFYIVILKLYTIIYKMYHINYKYICTKEIINISLFNVQRNYYNFIFPRCFYLKSFRFVPTHRNGRKAALNNIIYLNFSNCSMILSKCDNNVIFVETQ